MTSQPIEQTPPPPGPPASTEPKPNAFARMAGAIVSPEETFASIARRPEWVAPLLIWMAVALVGGIIFAQKVDFGAAARAAMEERSDIPPDAMENSVKIATAMGKVFAYCAPIIVAIIMFLVAGIFHLAFRLFGGEGTYKHSLAATVYAWTPNIIQSILTYIVVLAKSEVDATQMDTILRSNPAFLVSMKDNPVLYTLLSSLDIFSIWSLILFVIAFAFAMRVTKGKSAGIVIPLWLVYVLIKLVPAALRSMRG